MSEEMPLEIRFVTSDEWEDAIGLVWKTFLEFEGDVYPPEGVRNFEDFITDSALKRMFVMGSYQMMGAYLGNKIVCHSLPIRPGRNLAVIVESAAVNHRQKKMGYNAAEELYKRVQANIARKRES